MLYGADGTDAYDALAALMPEPETTRTVGDLRVAGDGLTAGRDGAVVLPGPGTARLEVHPDGPTFCARGCSAPDLFVAEHGDGCIFATDLSVLLEMMDGPAIDRDAFRLIMSRGADRTTRTLVEGVRRVPTDACLRPGHGATSREPDIPVPDGSLRSTIERSVERHTDGARPVIPLSGGIDSTSLAALASEQGRNPRGVIFDYGIDGPAAEDEYGRRVADHLGVESTTIDVAATGEGDVRDAVRQLAYPFAGVHWLPSLAIDVAADERVLFGHGTEEVFFKATDDFEQVHAAQRIRRFLPAPVRRPVAAILDRTGRPRGRKAAVLLTGTAEEISMSLVSDHTMAPPSSSYLSPARGPDGTLLERYGYQRFYRNTAPATRLTASALPAAAPFTDPELVAHGLSLPFEEKIRGGRYKAAFVDAVSDVLPSFVRERTQNQFADPSMAWLEDRWESVTERIRRLRGRDLLSIPEDTYLESAPNAAWRCYTLELWLEEFLDR